MSVGLDPPQIATRWPLLKPQRHLCCGWKSRGGEREAIGVGFASHQPWHLAGPVLAVHLSEVPIVTCWIKYFSLCSSNLSPECAPQVQ